MTSTLSDAVWTPTRSTPSSHLAPTPEIPLSGSPLPPVPPEQSWRLTGASTLAVQRTRSMLLRDAWAQFLRLSRVGAMDTTNELAHTFLSILKELVEDGGPLPQLGPSASGCLEVVWLVDGKSVGLIVEDSGDWLLWGEDAEGNTFLDDEGPYGTPPSLVALTIASERLVEMGRSVRFWPPVGQ